MLLTLLGFVGCQAGPEVEETPASEGRAHELRGGITLFLQPGTDLDADELAARDAYGATLTDDDGAPWFVRVESLDDASLDAQGLARATVDGAAVVLGNVQEDTGDECRVYVPFAPGRVVALSRPAGEIDCPVDADDVRAWLPAVEWSGDDDSTVASRAFGDYAGSFNGITANLNGSTNYDSGQYSTCGLKWQCVEYVNRYYYQYYGHKNLRGTGNANTYYSSAASKGLIAYPNAGSTKPAVGDMLASAGGSFGHIAIVREVGSNYVKVIHQNWSNSTADDSKTLTMTVSNGKYTVAGFSGSYSVQGWLRRAPGCSPSVSSVSPTSAWLGQSTTFTVTGSCLRGRPRRGSPNAPTCRW
ncbi:CHAP domain-containing protein [Nannocystis pusilla]|uniref:CHAP domain-containing protein n=1 Tax=Nannocystis pusilla TaxID=889268 RepID=UPI003B7C2C87